MMTHTEIWGAIDSFANAHNMSSSGLARTSGLNPTVFNNNKRWSKCGQEHWPSMRSIAKILDATDEDLGDFAKYLKSNKKPQ